MKIGIDISQIAHKGTGVARFTEGLTKAILDHDEKNHWLFFFSSLRQKLDKQLEQKIINKGHQLIKWKIPPTLLSFLWNDLHQFSSVLSGIQFSNNLDWFITSDWTEPPFQVKKATIVHDLVYLRYPETVDQKIRKTQNRRLSWVKEESKIIFADSQITKNDLVKLLNLDKNKIVVNYPGVSVVKPNAEQITQTLKKYHLTKPFILTVGKIEPRKNLKRLIEAMKQFNNETIELVIVGPQGWDTRVQSFKQLDSHIHFLGLVEDDDLFALYSSCFFFIYPSLWEGFGYPIVEAMKLGAAIACSSASSMKEITDDAALFFDPFNVNQMTQCINELSQDYNLKQELIKKGKQRSKIFTWKNYYDKMIKVFRESY